MELRVKDAGGVSSYIKLSGGAGSINIFKPTFLNGNDISNVGTLTSTIVTTASLTNNVTSTSYQPSRNIIANTINISCPSPSYNGEQLTIFSEGIAPSSSYINSASISRLVVQVLE